MATASILKPCNPTQSSIESNTLLEELFTYYSLSQLQAMLKAKPDQRLLQTWNVSPETFITDLKVAIEFVEND